MLEDTMRESDYLIDVGPERVSGEKLLLQERSKQVARNSKLQDSNTLIRKSAIPAPRECRVMVALSATGARGEQLL